MIQARCVLAIILLFALAGCGPTPATPTVNFTVKDIKGDTLGMGVGEYRKKHPGPCRTVTDLCVEADSYAGINGNKAVYFFNGHLYEIQYVLHPFFEKDILPDLKEKYGEPAQSNNNSFEWKNGTTTIQYSKAAKIISVTFSLDELKRQWAENYERQEAAAKKRDM
jgi:hypothetical protein